METDILEDLFGEDEPVSNEVRSNIENALDEMVSDYNGEGRISPVNENLEAEQRFTEDVENAEIPRISLPSDFDKHGISVLRIPNFVNTVCNPYFPAYFDPKDELDENETLDSEVFRTKLENTIRWRINSETKQKESNSRIVKWSDGSMSLQIGKNMYQLSCKEVDGNSYLYHYGKNGYVEGKGRISNQMSIRPFSTNTKEHKKLTAAFIGKHHKETRIRLMTTTEDPEKKKLLLELEEKEKMKAEKREKNKRRVALEKEKDNPYYSSARSGLSVLSKHSENEEDELDDKEYDEEGDESEEESVEDEDEEALEQKILEAKRSFFEDSDTEEPQSQNKSVRKVLESDDEQ